MNKEKINFSSLRRLSENYSVEGCKSLNLKVNVLQWDANIPSSSRQETRSDKTSMSSTISGRCSLIKIPEGDSWQGQGVLRNSVSPKLSYPNFFAARGPVGFRVSVFFLRLCTLFLHVL